MPSTPASCLTCAIPIERFIGYLKGSFWVPFVASMRQAGLQPDKAAANAAVARWLREVANARVHATTGEVPAERLPIETAKLQALPALWRAVGAQPSVTAGAQADPGLPASVGGLRRAAPGRCGVSSLQHERIVALAQELRLGALPDLYGAVAQSAAGRQDASYADFLEEVLIGSTGPWDSGSPARAMAGERSRRLRSSQVRWIRTSASTAVGRAC